MVVSSLSDAQVEAFLTDAVPTYVDLAPVAEVLSAVRAIAWTDSDVDFSGLFAAAARESRVTPIERFADERVALTKDWRPKVIPRVAIAGMALLVFMTVSSGLAYAADGAKPGDWMYGLDRAFEVVGVGVAALLNVSWRSKPLLVRVPSLRGYFTRPRCSMVYRQAMRPTRRSLLQ